MNREKNQKNHYFHLIGGRHEPININNPITYNHGKEYYIDIFRHLEDDSDFTGLTFYLSEVSPKELPTYGKDVVLVLIADEHYRYREYWPDLLAVIRTYPTWPKYLDGFPRSWSRWMSLTHFVYKWIGSFASFARAILKRKDLAMLHVSKLHLHTPLGSFHRFCPSVKPIQDRSLEWAFLGSVEYNDKKRKNLHSILQPPKLASRCRMLQVLSGYKKKRPSRSLLQTTGDFDESVCEASRYIQALENCKISICPRGSNPETYRFFESCAAGCVVICEPLPDAWFYRNNPAITIRDWKKLPEILDSLLADPQRLQRISMETRAFWLKQLSEKAVADKVISFLEDLLSGPRGTSNSLNFDSPVSPNS